MEQYLFRICAVLLATVFLAGCGPTRKEYAINEALLIDQTRMLEDQLYKAHFEVQHLRDENASLRQRLGEPQQDQESQVPFDRQNSAPQPQQPSRPSYPTGPAELPEDPVPSIDGSYYQPGTPLQPTGRYPAPASARYRMAQGSRVPASAPTQNRLR